MSKRKLQFNDDDDEDEDIDIADVVDVDSSSSSNSQVELSFCMSPCGQVEPNSSSFSNLMDDVHDQESEQKQIYAYKKAKLETLSNMALWIQQMAESIHTMSEHSKQLTVDLANIATVLENKFE